MNSLHIKIIFLVSLSIFGVATKSIAQEIKAEQHTQVSMRMIGHQVLLESGDSISLILPVEKIEGRYKIEFDTEFQLDPEKLVNIVNRVLKAGNTTKKYIIEVENCEKNEVVYSYKFSDSNNLISCQERLYQKACYIVFITILESNTSLISIATSRLDIFFPSIAQAGYLMLVALFIALLLLLTGLFIYFQKKRKKAIIAPNLISIGKYQFDKRSSELLIMHHRVALTGKESNLLLLLHNFVNTTVDREVILQKVWGDEGDYIGRTLDVFISKLRRKLEADANVKIINIRGVGYKLLVTIQP